MSLVGLQEKADAPKRWEMFNTKLSEYTAKLLGELKLDLDGRYILIRHVGDKVADITNQLGDPQKPARAATPKSGTTATSDRQGFVRGYGDNTQYNGEKVTLSPTALANKLGFKTEGYATTIDAFTDRGFGVDALKGDHFLVTGVGGKVTKTRKGDDYTIPAKLVS
jgi:hypothetical protein